MLTKVIMTNSYGSIGIRAGAGGGAAFVAKIERGFVAVMAVGDDQLFVAHLFLNRRNHAGIGNLPDPVDDAVFVGHIDGGSGVRSGREQGIDLAGIFVEQEKLLVVGTGSAKQVEAVGLGFGESLLVAEDDLGGIILDAAQSDESAALEAASQTGR